MEVVVAIRPIHESRLSIHLLVIPLLIALLGVIEARPASATVSGENGKIAFATDRDGNSEIYLMDADGSNAVNLTHNAAADSNPSWSPDGRHIVFVSDRHGSNALYTMQIDGAGVSLLTSGVEPAWSPDGARIAFSREDGIYLVNVHGGGVTRISNPHAAADQPIRTVSVRDSSPAWAPDGSRIAFVRRFQGSGPRDATARLYVAQVTDGGSLVALADVGWGSGAPDWSPDGTRIAIEEIGINSLRSQITLVSVDGSGTGLLPIPAGFTHTARPSWSPDGRLIAATAYGLALTRQEIVAMSLDGSGMVTNLTNNPAVDTDPAWQPLNPYSAGLVDPTTGIWYLRDGAGLVTSFFYGNPGDYPFVGDWNCDGVDTPGLYRQSDGYVYLRNSNTQGIADIKFFFGNPSDVPIAGDFDGDGCDTVSIYRPSEARIYVINELGHNDEGLGVADYSYLFGDLGDKPFVGDFDGDGIDTVGLYRETTGKVYYRNSNNQGVADNSFIYGIPGDRLVASDWNGDGMDSPAVFRPANTTFYFRFTTTQGTADAQYIWGESHWLPVSGNTEPS
jgi:hypothetical protein